MPSFMLCGRFHDTDHGQDRSRSSNKKIKGKSIEQHPNPYSGRGLDKFATVMAEVEAKKDKIMSEMKKSTSHSEAPLIQFRTRLDSNELVPVVVKPRNRRRLTSMPPGYQEATEKSNSSTSEDHLFVDEKKLHKTVEGTPSSSTAAAASRLRPLGMLSQYWPAFILIGGLISCLALFGRFFATLCTSTYWLPICTAQGPRIVFRRSNFSGWICGGMTFCCNFLNASWI